MNQLISTLGLLVIAIATVIPVAQGGFPATPWYKIIFTAGAALCLGAALFDRTVASLPLKEKRWKRIESWSAIFFCAGAFFLWWPEGTSRDWLAFTLAGAVIRIIVFFVSIRKRK